MKKIYHIPTTTLWSFSGDPLMDQIVLQVASPGTTVDPGSAMAPIRWLRSKL